MKDGIDLERHLAAKFIAALLVCISPSVSAQVLIGKGPAVVNSSGNLSRIEDGFIGVPYGSRGELLQIPTPNGAQNTYAYTSELNFLSLSTNPQTGVKTTSVVGNGPDPEVYSILINAQTPGDAFTNLKIENFSRVRIADAVNITSSDLTNTGAQGKPSFTLDMPVTRFLGEVEGGVSATVKTAYATTNMPASVYLDATGRKIRVDLDGGTSGSSATPATGAYSLALYFVDPENRGVNNTFIIPVNYFDRTKGPVLASTPGKDITLVPIEYGKLTVCLGAYNARAARIANLKKSVSLTATATANGVTTFCGDIAGDNLEVGEDVYLNIYLTDSKVDPILGNVETVVGEKVRYWGAPDCKDTGTVCGQQNDVDLVTPNLSGFFRYRPDLYVPQHQWVVRIYEKSTNNLIESVAVDWDASIGRYDNGPRGYLFKQKGSFDIRSSYRLNGRTSTILGTRTVNVK